MTETSFSTGHGSAIYTMLGCFGNETKLVDCNHTASDTCQSFDPYTGDVTVVQLVCRGELAPGKKSSLYVKRSCIDVSEPFNDESN